MRLGKRVAQFRAKLYFSLRASLSLTAAQLAPLAEFSLSPRQILHSWDIASFWDNVQERIFSAMTYTREKRERQRSNKLWCKRTHYQRDDGSHIRMKLKITPCANGMFISLGTIVLGIVWLKKRSREERMSQKKKKKVIFWKRRKKPRKKNVSIVNPISSLTAHKAPSAYLVRTGVQRATAYAYEISAWRASNFMQNLIKSSQRVHEPW